MKYSLSGTQTGRFSSKEPNFSNIPRPGLIDSIVGRRRRYEYPDFFKSLKPYSSYPYSSYSPFEAMILKTYDSKNYLSSLSASIRQLRVETDKLTESLQQLIRELNAKYPTCYIAAEPIEIKHNESFQVEINVPLHISQLQKICQCDMRLLLSAGCQCGGA